MASTPPDWSDSNLRCRSFRGQNLAGANFQGADLRGCDFRGANLTGANLAQARIGGAPQSILWGGLLMLGSAALALRMLSQLVFGIIGLTRTDPNYGLRWALLSILAAVGLLIGLIAAGQWVSRLLVVTAALEGALIGFFLGGLVSDLSLNIAILGSVLGALVLAGSIYWTRRHGTGIIVATIGVAMSNSMFFLAGVTLLQLVAARHFLAAAGWLTMAGLYGWSTIRAVGFLYEEFRQLGRTSFARATLHQVRWQ